MSRSTCFQSYQDVFLCLSSTCQKDVDLDVKHQPKQNRTIRYMDKRPCVHKGHWSDMSCT